MQKPPDLDIHGNPILTKPPDLDADGNPIEEHNVVADAKKSLDAATNISPISTSRVSEQPGESTLDKVSNIIKNIYHKSNEPLSGTTFTDLGHKAADMAVDPVSKFLDTHIGEFADSLTSPMNVAMMAATGGENILGKLGAGKLANIASMAGKGLGIPSAIEGLYNTYAKTTVGGKLGGIVQAIMGAAPFLHGPSTNVVPSESPKVDLNTGEILDDIPSAPNPTAGTPSFGGKGKPTGYAQKPDTIRLKAGGGLDKVQDVVGGGYKLSGQDPDGSYVFTKTPDAPLTETQLADNQPTPKNVRTQLGPAVDTKKGHIISDILALPRSIMASTDMSAPLRQGLPLIHKKEYWQAIPDLVKAFGSENAYNAVQESIANKPLFKPRIASNGKEIDSFAKQAGLKLTDLHDLTDKEEMLQSSLAERIPLFGKVYRASERSYTAFLNKLRADTFEDLINKKNIFSGDGEANLAGARAIADFVNNATGRGSLDFTLKTGGKTIIPANLESAAEALGNIFFAPRLMASRIRMLNPMHYMAAPPEVRMERLKSLLAVAAAGNTVGQLGKMIGGEVETNPNSSDYGKIKFGNIHIDPWAGFQQYVVAANRLIRPESAQMGEPTNYSDFHPNIPGSVGADLFTGMLGNPGGHMKSTVTGHDYSLGSSPVGSNKSDVLFRFGRYKLNPSVAGALDILLQKDANNQPINVPEEIASKFTPIFLQDLKQLATENPNLLPNFGGIQDKFGGDSYSEFHPWNLTAAPLSFFGMGTQTYNSRR